MEVTKCLDGRLVDRTLSGDDHAVRRDPRRTWIIARPRACQPPPRGPDHLVLRAGRWSAQAPSGPGCWRAPGWRRRPRAVRLSGTGRRPLPPPPPMKTAPTAAIVISNSIENGVPAIAAETARLAIGISPTIIASKNAHCSVAGMAFSIAKATARAAPDAIVKTPLLVCHHLLSAGPWS
jgi:hypothetical protein